MKLPLRFAQFVSVAVAAAACTQAVDSLEASAAGSETSETQKALPSTGDARIDSAIAELDKTYRAKFAAQEAKIAALEARAVHTDLIPMPIGFGGSSGGVVQLPPPPVTAQDVQNQLSAFQNTVNNRLEKDEITITALQSGASNDSSSISSLASQLSAFDSRLTTDEGNITTALDPHRVGLPAGYCGTYFPQAQSGSTTYYVFGLEPCQH
jgi:hypothetical protein